jgi:hypothetical protein
MYYILCAVRWKKYTYYTWPCSHNSRWQWSWWGTQLKVCLKRARIPLQLHHNAQGNTQDIAVDLGRLFKMYASPQLIPSSQTCNLVSHYQLQHHPKQMTISSANATHQTLTPTSAWSVQQIPFSYYRWLKLVLFCFKLVAYIYYAAFCNTFHFGDAEEPNTRVYSSPKCTFNYLYTKNVHILHGSDSHSSLQVCIHHANWELRAYPLHKFQDYKSAAIIVSFYSCDRLELKHRQNNYVKYHKHVP